MGVIQPNTADMVSLAPMPVGTWRASIVACRTGISKEKKTPMIIPKFLVSYVSDDGKSGTKEREAWIVTEGPGSFNFDQLLRAVNMDELADQYADENQAGPAFDTDTLIGQELNVMVDHQDYQGSIRDTINGYLKV